MCEQLETIRASFKYWKRRQPPPCPNKAVNLHNDSTLPNDVVRKELQKIDLEKSLWEQFGLISPDQWKVYTFNSNKGLIYIKNPFSLRGQRYWIARCLRDFPKKPHKLNIDAHDYLNADEDWWTTSHDNNVDRCKNLLKSLRWATLGYHHDWDTKLYTEENKHNFPSDLGELCKLIAASLGFDNYMPQASIVNYYHMDSTLAPHTDHSEKNLDAPLISISFGQSAIFLIGSELKNDEPTAMYLHSGDIVIMSKDSRLCYHAVPRIVKAVDQPWMLDSQCNQHNITEFKNSFTDNLYDVEFWKPFDEYINSSRININVRQVLFSHQNSLDDR
ncbi:alpha-ketoglutarate-dependent dioxygenase AlkB [Arctopsyche grandis]|uniref:alpha-ketoglutarate-dependent dioxygenase AlkB n=1 Tax=Arctopsyche grandis TaxID=121162 RepID=UPI00406D892A